MTASVFIFAGHLVYIPLEIRRARDMKLDLGWLIAKWITIFIPLELFFANGVTARIFVLQFAYGWLIEALLIFRPGETYKSYKHNRSASDDITSK